MPVLPNQSAASATAANTPVQLQLQQFDAEARLILTGTYTGLQGVIQGSQSTSPTPPAYNDASWVPLAAQDESVGTLATGTLAPAAANKSYYIKCGGFNWLQFNPTQVTTGTATMTLYSKNTLGGGGVNSAV